jgi:integrase/recombinase XerD
MDGCARRVFFEITLGQDEAFERIISGEDPEKLPPVLNREEIARLLSAVSGFRNRVALATARGGSCAPEDRLGRRKWTLLHIENGKGGSDRRAMLLPRLLEILRAYWKAGAAEFMAVFRVRSGGHARHGALRCPCHAARRCALGVSIKVEAGAITATV